DHLVVGRQRVDLGVDLGHQVLGGQAARAEVFVGPLHVQRLFSTGACGEVHAQDFAIPSHDASSSGSGRSRGIGLGGPGAHLVDAGPVGIHVRDGAGRAGAGAGGVALAQVALLHLAAVLVVVDGAE